MEAQAEAEDEVEAEAEAEAQPRSLKTDLKNAEIKFVDISREIKIQETEDHVASSSFILRVVTVCSTPRRQATAEVRTRGWKPQKISRIEESCSCPQPEKFKSL